MKSRLKCFVEQILNDAEKHNAFFITTIIWLQDEIRYF